MPKKLVRAKPSTRLKYPPTFTTRPPATELVDKPVPAATPVAEQKRSPRPPAADRHDDDLAVCPRCRSGDTFATSSPGATLADGTRIRVCYRRCRSCDVTYKGTSTILSRRQA